MKKKWSSVSVPWNLSYVAGFHQDAAREKERKIKMLKSDKKYLIRDGSIADKTVRLINFIDRHEKLSAAIIFALFWAVFYAVVLDTYPV